MYKISTQKKSLEKKPSTKSAKIVMKKDPYISDDFPRKKIEKN